MGIAPGSKFFLQDFSQKNPAKRASPNKETASRGITL